MVTKCEDCTNGVEYRVHGSAAGVTMRKYVCELHLEGALAQVVTFISRFAKHADTTRIVSVRL